MLIELLLMIFPVFLAGIVFILIRYKFPNFLKYPIDFNKKIFGKGIFGGNKNFRGPLIMALGTGIFGSIFYGVFYPYSNSIFTNYCLVGLFYSLGELPNSFIKRQLGIKPGEGLKRGPLKLLTLFIDNFDSIVAVSFAYLFVFKFRILAIMICVLLGGILHFVIHVIMIRFRLKKSKYVY